MFRRFTAPFFYFRAQIHCGSGTQHAMSLIRYKKSSLLYIKLEEKDCLEIFSTIKWNWKSVSLFLREVSSFTLKGRIKCRFMNEKHKWDASTLVCLSSDQKIHLTLSQYFGSICGKQISLNGLFRSSCCPRRVLVKSEK